MYVRLDVLLLLWRGFAAWLNVKRRYYFDLRKLMEVKRCSGLVSSEFCLVLLGWAVWVEM